MYRIRNIFVLWIASHVLTRLSNENHSQPKWSGPEAKEFLMTLDDVANLSALSTEKMNIINTYLNKRSVLRRIKLRFLKREYLSKARMLNRSCDYIQVIMRMLSENKGISNHILTQVSQHLSLIPSQGIEKLTSSSATEIKNRLKVDAVNIASHVHDDGYLYVCLSREINLLAKKKQEKDFPGSVDLPSEELNTAWDLFIPTNHLHRLHKSVKEYVQPEVITNNSGVASDTEESSSVADNVSGLPNPLRLQASRALEYLYLSRSETIRYRGAKGEIRGVYYRNLALFMLLFLAMFVTVSQYEFHQGMIHTDSWRFNTGGTTFVSIILIVLLSGAIGSALALMLKFRNLNRIADLRQTFGMLLAQVCTGATAALLFFIILRAGWVKLGLLDESWYPVTPQGELTQVPNLPLAEVVLVAFLAGFSETLFLNILEKTGTMFGGQSASQPSK